MSTFQLTKYMDDEEKAKVVSEPDTQTETDPKSPEGRKAVKEIQITSLKDEKGTAIVAKALIQALRKDDIDMLDINERNDRIFKEIKVVTEEDVKDSIADSTKFALEGNADVIIMPGVTKLDEGQVLLNNLEGKENVYIGPDEYYEKSGLSEFTEENVISMDADNFAKDDAEELIRIIKEEEQLSMEELTVIKDKGLTEERYRVGDTTEHGVIVFVDQLVVLFRKENEDKVLYTAMERI